MSETRIYDEKLNEIYELKQQKKAIEDRLKELEKPYKTALFRDGLSWETNKILMDMEETKRLVITPDAFRTAYPDLFMGCVEVKISKAKSEVQRVLQLVKEEEATEKLKLIGSEVPYQKLLNFKLKEK